ncbi:MAG: polysaccharide pyruvyl transferase family protein [Saccharofermentans sp.]|nr:polysaccharide pyruvyl transferase family protein [Saccharofermentans sp.]
MKIGIVTYWKSSNNYGEQLQNFALQEYLKGLGHDPFLIRYDYENDTIYGSKPLHIRLLRACNPNRLIKYFKSRSDNKKRVRDNLLHPRGFEDFRNRYLSMSRVYSSIEDLRSDPPEAEMYITGSDQVWNTFEGSFSEMKNRISTFFLDFGKQGVKKISYAASWGRSSVPEDEAEMIKPLLARFDAVSVREESGVDLCRRLGRGDAVMALDPVLLHDAEVYRKLYRGSSANKPDGKYVFFYFMNNDGAYDRKAVFDWAESKGLKVVYVTDDWHDGLEKTYPGVREWLELLDNSECVVTNSFHCSVLSVIFGKRFGVIKRFGHYSGMNTRMDSLFCVLGISPRYIDDEGFEILERPAENESIMRNNDVMTPEKVLEMAMTKGDS